MKHLLTRFFDMRAGKPKLIAKIHADNARSRKAFEALRLSAHETLPCPALLAQGDVGRYLRLLRENPADHGTHIRKLASAIEIA